MHAIPYLVVIDFERKPKGRQWSQDVRKQNNTIWLEGLPRLQRDFHDQIRGLGALSERRMLLREFTVRLWTAAFKNKELVSQIAIGIALK